MKHDVDVWSCMNLELKFLGILAKGIRVSNNFEAECQAFVMVVVLAKTKGWKSVWFEADYMALVNTFNKGIESWDLTARWHRAI
ncbi:hypothetical protein FRX31_032285 [Thalictrum thalictroides]|uniref:RNase H type-1 domain-containing protein n=1 Tax=Thalictrum thalictroides TaxID=46969 RepID=A0A7J6V094_THATH|nr:hypothetical protein FRX31_032285 [Thalictrum thalictroides]